MQDVPSSWLIFIYNQIYEEEQAGNPPTDDRLDLYEYVRERADDIVMECPNKEMFGYAYAASGDGLDDDADEESERVDDADGLVFKEDNSADPEPEYEP